MLRGIYRVLASMKLVNWNTAAVGRYLLMAYIR